VPFTLEGVDGSDVAPLWFRSQHGYCVWFTPSLAYLARCIPQRLIQALQSAVLFNCTVDLASYRSLRSARNDWAVQFSVHHTMSTRHHSLSSNDSCSNWLCAWDKISMQITVVKNMTKWTQNKREWGILTLNTNFWSINFLTTFGWKSGDSRNLRNTSYTNCWHRQRDTPTDHQLCHWQQTTADLVEYMQAG